MKFKAVVFLFLTFISLHASGDKLGKAFEKLRAYNYFEAKELFMRALENDPVAAGYGLSKIFFRTDNPFSNLDSSWKYLNVVIENLPLLKEKQLRDYALLGVVPDSIHALSSQICASAFEKISKEDSVERYEFFLQYYNTCAEFEKVTELRNNKAFNNAVKQDTSAAFLSFLDNYPNAKQRDAAKNKYNESLFIENTRGGTIADYESFIRNFPQNTYRVAAERKIYELSVKNKTAKEYAAFARKYPTSPHATEAWRELYVLTMKDYSPEKYEQFKSDFPDYPFMDEFESDYRLQTYSFIPFSKHGKMGFINEFGAVMIQNSFDEVRNFSDGLAAVIKNNKTGYINKSGKEIIPCLYSEGEDFINGSAIVHNDSVSGLIDHKGKVLLPLGFEDISDAGENFCIAMKDGKSAYYRRNGEELTKFILDVAGDFKNGNAVVQVKDRSGLLNNNGHLSVEPQYDQLIYIGVDRYKAALDNKWGIITSKGSIVLNIEYDAIGDYADNRVLIAKEGKCGYADSSGVIVIPLNFKFSSILLSTGQFQNGYALLRHHASPTIIDESSPPRTNFKTVLIDTSGKIISIPGIQNAGYPSDGLIPVKKKNKWGYADMKGTIKIPCRYTYAGLFKDHFAIVKNQAMVALVDTTGKEIIPFLFSEITPQGEYFIVKKEEKAGLYSAAGKEILPCEYESIHVLSNNIKKAITQLGETIFNLQTGKIIYTSVQ